MSKYKTEQVTGSLSTAIADAISCADELAQEMGEWRDNTEEKLGHTDKWQRVSDAADALEEISSELGCLDELPAWLADRPVKWVLMRPYKGRSEPRWMRAANAAAPLHAVVEMLSEGLDDGSDTLKPDRDWYTGHLAQACELLSRVTVRGASGALRADINQLIAAVKTVEEIDTDLISSVCDTLREQAEALEQIEFPRMYG